MAREESIAAFRFGTGFRPDAEPQTAAAMLAGVPAEASAAGARPSTLTDRTALFRRFAKIRRQGGPNTVDDRNAARVAIERGLTEARAARVATAVAAPNPFYERLVWFWSDHFSVSALSILGKAIVPAYEDDAIRPKVAGRFVDLLRAADTHPAMLEYLGQARSVGPNSAVGLARGRGLNENLGREMLELHTLGAGADYTQDDVRQVAALLTGLSANGRGEQVFRPDMAEPGAETVLGNRYGGEKASEADIDAAMADLARHPATARHIATKLAVHFVSDTPDPDLVDTLEAAYRDSDGDLMAVYTALIEHPASAAPLGAKVRQPFEFVVASLRAAGPPTPPKPTPRRADVGRFRGRRQGFAGEPRSGDRPPADEPAGVARAAAQWLARAGGRLDLAAGPDGAHRLGLVGRLGDRGDDRPARLYRYRPRRPRQPGDPGGCPRRSGALGGYRPRSRLPGVQPAMSDPVALAGLTRRTLIGRGLTLGAACCIAASPLVTPVVLASAPGDNRLVVIVLRGAMDSIAAFPPLADPALAALRPQLGQVQGVLSLDGRFGLHPALAPLLPLWQGGQLAIAQAVATPYRDKRSHFDGQDLLEAGVSETGAVRDGWLNRALGLIPDAQTETALSVGRENMLLLRGPAPTRAWSPGDRLRLRNDERGLLDRLYAADPLFAAAAQGAARLSALDGPQGKPEPGVDPIARFAGQRLAAEARIAAFSIGGWDTHVSQRTAMVAPLTRLAASITTLRDSIGPAWDTTLVIAMTEFGRTVAENGTAGTDHGTGGTAILAGGALAGGRVYGDWPGLAESALYQGRDLMPTVDVRHYPALALEALFGLDRDAIGRDVFPGLDLGAGPRFLA